jgi:acrylyl-CoA reductase (NADPH)
MFRAILLERVDGHTSAKVAEIDPARLPVGDVSVRVAYSTINYKDGLAITGKGPVVRAWPISRCARPWRSAPPDTPRCCA